MSKKQILNEFINILAVALRHKIGSIVNSEEIYAQKYSRDAEILIKEAEKVKEQGNWNNQDKIIIREILQKKLKKELEEKDFLSNKKFDIMDEEMDKVLNRLRLK